MDESSKFDITKVDINNTFNAHFTSSNLTVSNVSLISADYSKFLNVGSFGLRGRSSGTTVKLSGSTFDDSFFFLRVLDDTGVIKSPSYLLWLGADYLNYGMPSNYDNTTLSECGKLVSGAVDPTFYTGTLVQLHMIPYQNLDTNEVSTGYPIVLMGPLYIVEESGASLNMTSNDFLEPALLDSRHTTSCLPLDTILQIAIQLEASYVEDLGSWVVACTIAEENVILLFHFGGVPIEVPLNDFLTAIIDPDTNKPIRIANGANACYVALYPNTAIGYNVLGGPFLKNAYLVVDNEGQDIALAQAVTASSIGFRVSFESGPSTFSESSSVKAITVTNNVSTNIKISSSNGSSFDNLATAAAILSGSIPYATVANITGTSDLTLSLVVTADYNVTFPLELTALLYSNGLISQGRSFYDTARTATTKKLS